MQNQNNVLAGVDFNQYASWERITAPTGAVYYVVPNTGWVYDPFLSQSKGRPVLFQNPKPEIAAREERKAEEQRARDLQDRQIAMQEQAASPLGQAAPILGTTAGAVAAPYLLNQAGITTTGESIAAAIPKAPTILEAGRTAASTASGAFAQGAGIAGPHGIGPIANGAEYASNIAPQTGFFDIGGGLLGDQPMGPGGYVPGVIGAYQAYDLFKNKKHGGEGARQGAMAGAGIGLTVGGPVGAGIGAVIGGIGGYFGNLGDKDMWQTEAEEWDKLVEQGLATPEEAAAAWERAYTTRGMSKEELAQLAEQTGGNVAFARSRNESDLRPEDIIGYASVQSKARQEGMDARTIAQQALDAGAVREHHGTIDVDWGKVNFDAPIETPSGIELNNSTPPQMPGGARTPISKPTPPPADATKSASNQQMGKKLANRMNLRYKRG